ncbi:MAG: hypothetical protein R3222_11105, partial [Balneolaceae bacterium]|nr:hypothetical protein [Balneolaceae bacterium]
IIGEILRSLARTYGWPGFKPKEKEIRDVPPGQLKALQGTYIYGQAQIRVAAGEKRLSFTQSWDGIEYPIYPENDSTFFNSITGDEFVFRVESGKPGLQWDNFFFTKKDN